MRMLSLFSGAGGFDLGMEGDFYCLKESINENINQDWITEEKGRYVKLAPTGFNTVFACDINPHAKRAWTNYFKNKKPNANEIYHLDSIVDLVKAHRSGALVFPKDIDLVIGGFPCQDFSVAGKQKGFKSTVSHRGKKDESCAPGESRGTLYQWMKETIAITQPKAFIAENVQGLLSIKGAKETIANDFASAGYLVVPVQSLYSPDYGVPQMRRRIFFIGFKKSALTDSALRALSSPVIDNEYSPYPQKTHGADLKPYVTCGQVFAGMPEPENSEDPSQQELEKTKYYGGNHLGEQELLPNKVSLTICTKGTTYFRRMSLEHGGSMFAGLEHHLKERRCTVREAALLQTFPYDYEFILPKDGNHKALCKSPAYALIGNAVPCVLAYNIAQSLKAKWPLYFG